LAGVTQVVSASEGHIFHNRLTHTLEVAQIARRITEKLIRDERPELVHVIGGLDSEVAESAALAHDLGHPPFGHIAEDELNKISSRAGLKDGFEGNAQSFRIVTRLARRSSKFPGLNLTRATLNGILKYPWSYASGLHKWGAYHTEQSDFRWARALTPGREKSPEAEIMDWSDDVGYAVHDVEDFYRAGFIPLDRLFRDDAEVTRFLDSVYERRRRQGNQNVYSEKDLATAFQELRSLFAAIVPASLLQPYSGTLDQRSALRTLTSFLIGRYVAAIRLRRPDAKSRKCVSINTAAEQEVHILKQLAWTYVIENPSLTTQQYGQRKVVRDLFDIFVHESMASNTTIFPAPYRELIERAGQNPKKKDGGRVRAVVDMIAGMTEQAAINMHRRLTGVSLGSVTDIIVR
jgi:dGTPase